MAEANDREPAKGKGKTIMYCLLLLLVVECWSAKSGVVGYHRGDVKNPVRRGGRGKGGGGNPSAGTIERQPAQSVQQYSVLSLRKTPKAVSTEAQTFA